MVAARLSEARLTTRQNDKAGESETTPSNKICGARDRSGVSAPLPGLPPAIARRAHARLRPRRPPEGKAAAPEMLFPPRTTPRRSGRQASARIQFRPASDTKWDREG